MLFPVGFLSSGNALDADAQAFIDACATAGHALTAGEQTAINDFVVSLKGDSLWSKMHACYPMIGGDALSHQFNLVDPQDLDASFRLTFVGSPTHDASGVDTNGSSQYCNTHYKPNAQATIYDCHLSYLTDQEIGEAKVDLGVTNSSPNNGAFELFTKWTDGNRYGDFHTGSGTGRSSGAATGSGKVITVTRRANNDLALYENGSVLATNTSTHSVNSTFLPNYDLYINAQSTAGTPGSYSTKRIQFASVGTKLTATDVSNLSTAVLALQAALGR